MVYSTIDEMDGDSEGAGKVEVVILQPRSEVRDDERD